MHRIFSSNFFVSQDDTRLHDYNVDERVNTFIKDMEEQVSSHVY